jgi:hypothetical protein
MTARFLILAAFVGALLCIVTLDRRTITPAYADLAVEPHGSFQRDGQNPSAPLALAHARGVRVWGSWSGSDANTGALVLGPFPAPAVLRFAVVGFPNAEGDQLSLERLDTHEQQKITAPDAGGEWRIVDCLPPRDWVGRPVRVIAIDQAKQFGGWLGLSEPIRGGHGDGNYALVETLALWVVSGWVFAVLWLAARDWLALRAWVAPQWLPLLAAGAVATAGYALFWAYFAHPVIGQVGSTAMLLGGLYAAWTRPKANAQLDPESLAAVKLLLAIGLGYLALVHLFPSSRGFYDLAATRFMENLPGDNTLPYNVASDLFHGRSLRWPGADWHSSDRPPLQSGWQLLSWPVTAALQLDPSNASALAGVWLQSLWVFGVYGLLRTLGLSLRRAGAWLAVLAITGFFLENTVYTWPKLSAGAFACGTFALWLAPAPGGRRRAEIACGAALAGLAWLSHGGVAFSFLVLAPWVAWQALRGDWRGWVAGGAIFAAFALPWLAYQKFYDPPGNRLFKWHLGGQIPIDNRGVAQTIRDGYRRLSWREIVAVRQTNFQFQIAGNWQWWRDFSPATARDRRNNEFFAIGRSLTWWLLGLAAWPLVLLRRRARLPWRFPAALAAWTGGTIVIWCLLLFGSWQASIHQGSYAVLLALFALLSAGLERAGKWLIGPVALLQLASFTTTWAVPNAVIFGPINFLALTLALVAGGYLAVTVGRASFSRETLW